MKNTPISSYQIIFEALLKDGYSEQDAEQIICDVIEDQIDYSDFAQRVHNILKDLKESKFS